MRALAIIVLVSGCGEKGAGASCENGLDCDSRACVNMKCSSGQIGSPCDETYHCVTNSGPSTHCFEWKCRERGRTNERCNTSKDCTPGLECLEGACRDETGKRKVAVERETKMLASSGVEPGSRVETATPAPGAGSRVRTVTTTAEASAFAACKADERLVGGGCRASLDKPAIASFPSEHSPEDTVAARWNCTGYKSEEITAYALCAKLP